MALPFLVSDAVLLASQAALVAAPGVGLPAGVRLPHGRGWALVPPASIVAVVFGLQLAPGGASALTYLALLTTPPLAALALAWGLRRSRPATALLVFPLLVIAWAANGALAGQACALALSALAVVTLGRLLVVIAPLGWLKVGIVAMAVIDAILVVADQLQGPNAVLNAAAPAAGLPRLQLAEFGTAVMGYGDLFIAALLGAVLAQESANQRWAAMCCLVLAGLFDLLFFFVHVLPATVPVAGTLIVVQLARRRGARWVGAGVARLPASGTA